MANHDLTAMVGEGISGIMVSTPIGIPNYNYCHFSEVQKHAGSYSLCVYPGGFKEVLCAAAAEETTIDVWCYYETGANLVVDIVKLGDGTILDSQEPVGGADAWEKLTLTFTPAAAGIFLIRLKNVKFDDGVGGICRAFFDDIE